MKNNLTAFEQELLQKAFLVLERNMSFEEEDEIARIAGSSVSDIIDLIKKLENIHGKIK